MVHGKSSGVLGPAAFAVLAAVLLAGAGASAARADKAKGKPPEIVEEADGDLLHLHRKDDPAAQGWLHRPKEIENPDPGSPVDLIVVLHGAGGTPKTLFFPRVMQARKAWCLGVAGHEAVKHEQGEGFMWDGSNVSYILDLVRHVIAKYPVRKDRVIVWGHSAGGTMTLETLAAAPDLFAGGLTTAAPATPDSRHRDLRVAVFLGTKDANWGGAASVRTHLEGLEKKKAKGACAFVAVTDLGHNVPEEDYLGLGFDWILSRTEKGGGARGGAATVPIKAVGIEGPWRHILARHKGAEGAGDVKTSKKAAQDLLKKIKKDVDAGKAFFPFEAACHSEHVETASCGGGIEEEALRTLLGSLPDVASGKTSEVLESPRGIHLVWKD